MCSVILVRIFARVGKPASKTRTVRGKPLDVARELVREGPAFGGILAGFTRIEPQVLEQHDVTVVECRDSRTSGISDRLIDELHRSVKKL